MKMVNCSILLGFLIVLISTPIMAESRLGYLAESQAFLTYTNFSSSNSDKIAGAELNIRTSYSLLGNLIFSDSPFIIGDHIGVGVGVGYYSKKNDDVPYMIPFNLEFGLKSSYAISNDLEVGIKWMIIGFNYYTDLKNDFKLQQKHAIIPTVRIEDVMFSAGYGLSSIGEISGPAVGKYYMAEGRILFGDQYILLRGEKYDGKYDSSLTNAGIRKDKCYQISIAVGMM